MHREGRFMKRIAAAAVAALLCGCTGPVVRPGSVVRGDLPGKSHTLAQAWEEAGEVLTALGHPMDTDVYTEVRRISGNGVTVVEVRSHDFDPAAAVLDGSGNLLAFCDDWNGGASARLVLENIPENASLLIFSKNDERGLYDLLATSGDSEDLEAFRRATDLSSGPVTSALHGGSGNRILGGLLRDALESHVYDSAFDRAMLFPFSVQEEAMVSISLESDSFDPLLVLLSVEKGAYVFQEMNDDYDGVWSRIIRELSPGDYMAVVLPYSREGEGEFTLRLEPVDRAALQPEPVEAEAPGVEYLGTLEPGRNYAAGWWPEMVNDYQVPSQLRPFSPVAGFTFGVEETGGYVLTAGGETDVYMTLLRSTGDGMEFVAYNDDYQGLGTDSRVEGILIPGEYSALVSAYNGGEYGPVSFSWNRLEIRPATLAPGRPVRVSAPEETAKLYFRFEVEEGHEYTVSVESGELDPVINAYLPDGGILYDDDGGGGTNSLLSFTAGPGQGGRCFLTVEKYSPGDGFFTVTLSED
jgi:hypothetical protein